MNPHARSKHAILPKYRPDIDGLRAVAILSVLGYHAFPDLLPGGFVGVDVFFVISGFLISSIIFASFEKESFSYVEFYTRRIRRIFPALAVVLAVTFALGWFLLLPDEFKQLGKYTAAGAGFVSNLVSWNEAGYFDNASDTKPLLHLWSLGVEEQFYIFWPLLIGICWRYRFNFLMTTLVIALLSFITNIYTVQSDPTADFFSPLSRFWELMAGGVLAYAFLHKSKYLAWLSNWQSVAGAVLIVSAILLIDEHKRFPGWWALFPVVGTFLLISAQPGAWVNRYILSSRPMVAIGLISYPLYLWHLPLLIIPGIVSFGNLDPLVRVGLLAASFVLAGATYFFIEKPLRFTLPARKTAVGLLAAMSIVLLAGLAVMLQAGLPGRFPEALQPYFTFVETYDYKTDARVHTCWLNDKDKPDGFDPSCIDPPQPGKPLVVLWGDSHAARLYPGLKAAYGGNIRIAQFTRNACAPILNEGRFKWCNKANDYVISRIGELHPDEVILFSRWSRHFTLSQSDPRFNKLARTIDAINKTGVKRIILIGPAPNWKGALPTDLLRDAVHHRDFDIPTRKSSMLVQEVPKIDQMMRTRFANMPRVTYFSAYDALCDESGCLTTVDGKADGLTTFDYGHLTTAGATYVAKKMLEQIEIFRTDASDPTK